MKFNALNRVTSNGSLTKYAMFYFKRSALQLIHSFVCSRDNRVVSEKVLGMFSEFIAFPPAGILIVVGSS